MDIHQVRKFYPITEKDIYLNHAATAPVAGATIKRMQHIAAEMERPLSEHFYPWLGILEETRRFLAELINAHPREIAFCQNTSTALSLIGNAIRFQPGDRILVPRDEFPSNIYIWQSLQSKGVTFEFIDLRSDESVVETLKKIDLKQVRLFSISAVSYYTGRLAELEDIVKFCRERDILVCYDAIQALGAVPFDVQKIQPDFIASGAQKWLLGSVGAGFVYARSEWLNKLSVPLVGWTSVKYPEDFSLKELDFATEMTRFEPGLPDILPFAALNQSLRDLNKIGWAQIYQRVRENTNYLEQALQAHGIQTLAHHNPTAGIVSFEIPPQLDSEAFQKALAQHKIHLTQRHNYMRISPHFYNTKAELDCFLNTLKMKAAKQQQKQIVTESTVVKQNTAILLTGATGILGQALAREIASLGHALTITARSQDKLEILKEKLEAEHHVKVHVEVADFDHDKSFSEFLQRLKAHEIKYDAYINCAGIAEADEFTRLSVEKFKAMLQINCVAHFQLMQLFLNELKSDRALGILNIISGTARCGIPLLSGYAASQGSLWSLGEAIERELSHESLTITNYIAPPMHSRMQKKLGRAALRYFKLSGDFPYAQSKEVAKEAWTVFNKKQSLFVNPYHRWTLRLNYFLPQFITKRIKRIWKV